jgi:1,4-dihydroxy-2-naphthoyl-CoA hydrolase
MAINDRCKNMASIFRKDFEVADIQHYSRNTLAEHLGIEFTEKGEDYLVARLPVDARTVQPFRLLHGGASVALAETMGSIASWLTLPADSTQSAVGLEINANHLRAVRSGWVYGRATPIHLGRRTHVWEIRITDESQKPVCVSRLTVMLIDQE